MAVSKFLIRPRPQSGETLSSWRQRSGWANGYVLFPVQHEGRRRVDPDVGSKVDEIQWLADSHDLTFQQVAELTLAAFHHVVLKVPLNSKHPRWWLRSRTLHGFTMSGPMACPQCLASDEIPYFRLHWRLGYFTSCAIHGSRLIDQCPRCHHPLWPTGGGVVSRFSPKFISMRMCWHCGFDLGRASSYEESNPATITLNGWLSHRQAVIHDVAYPISEVLDALRGVCQLFLRRQSREAIQRADGSGRQVANRLSPHAIQALAVEHLGVHDRQLLVSEAMSMIVNWPDAFVQFARSNGISRMHFFGLSQLLPVWMNSCINQRLALQNRWVTKSMIAQEIENLTGQLGRHPTKTEVRKALHWQGAAFLDAFYPARVCAQSTDVPPVRSA